jgi:hypothetical protein
MKSNLVFSGLLSVTLIALVVLSNTNYAWAITERDKQPSILASDAIKNNPLAMKILQNIEISKQRIAQMQQAKKDLLLVEEKRKIAKNLEEQAYQSLQARAQVNSSKNSFDRFVATVQNNSTKKVFADQFDFMNARIDLGHAAMKKILDNGGTWEEAMNAFSQYAAIKRVEMIQTNQNLNLQHGMSDTIVQASFDKNGRLPDNYIKMPAVFLSH